MVHGDRMVAVRQARHDGFDFRQRLPHGPRNEEGDAADHQQDQCRNAAQLRRRAPEDGVQIVDINTGSDHPAPILLKLRVTQFRRGVVAVRARPVIGDVIAAALRGGDEFPDNGDAVFVLQPAQVLALEARLGRMGQGYGLLGKNEVVTVGGEPGIARGLQRLCLCLLDRDLSRVGAGGKRIHDADKAVNMLLDALLPVAERLCIYGVQADARDGDQAECRDGENKK